jgi:hypothetical protein
MTRVIPNDTDVASDAGSRVTEKISEAAAAATNTVADLGRGVAAKAVPGFQEQFEKVTRHETEAPNNAPLPQLPR